MDGGSFFSPDTASLKTSVPHTTTAALSQIPLPRDLSHQGHVSRKSWKLFGTEKPFVKLRLAYSVKLVFSCFVKRIKTKITSKFRASRRLCFEDTKRIMSPEMRPESFGTFEKRAPGPNGSDEQSDLPQGTFQSDKSASSLFLGL